MSHNATNWAIKQRGISPAAKLLLWHLADCHNAHTGRCDPSQDRLARECEISKATLNRQMLTLENAGLIKRVQRVNKATKERERTFYILCLEDEFEPYLEDASSHYETRKPMSHNDQNPCLKNAETHVSKCDINPVREPGKRTGNKKNTKKDLPIDFLTPVVGAEIAQEVIAHRIKIKSALTAFAAKNLAAQFAKCADPAEAATTMIVNGWRGFKPEWIENKPNNKPQSAFGAAADKLISEMSDEESRYFGSDASNQGSSGSVLLEHDRG